MRTRLLQFIAALREGGLDPTIAETLDAMQAAAVAGVDRSVLREALAATLVKDEADRDAFEAVFDRFFAVPRPQRPAGRQRTKGGEGSSRDRLARTQAPEAGYGMSAAATAPRGSQRVLRHRERDRERPRASQLARRRVLAELPFERLPVDRIEECDQLAEELARRFRAHLARRQRHAQRGRLDIRRTVRRSLNTGGVPLLPAFRRRRPGRPDLVALCDHSHSVATASRFLLGLLQPAGHFFRRVHLFAYVDSAVEISIERGRLVPHEPLDLYARSDFGRALEGFHTRHDALLTRNTVLLVLGDARNNRRPPRADILARMRQRVRRIVWLNPESTSRWNTGDSVMQAYLSHCDAVLGATNLRQLSSALRLLLSREL